MVDVIVMLGEAIGSQFIYPFIIDGMMVVATISLIELTRFGDHVQAVEVRTESESAAKRKCPVGCTCGRHAAKRKAPAKRTRRIIVPQPASSPEAESVAAVTV
jgi:hypothetical protein